ncbi:MAG: GDP-mannose 4,6-dehydratase [Nitrospinae bacterium]|nr:GDP-mannose 4,6-dehydratase [Nitrospinota bacterium]MBF0633225.1 GDP-mannose 4,6-dehydratase [Nitrospinota bacterium]
MKKILVTGATGFVGGHLITLLSREGGNEIVGTYHSTAPSASSPASYVKVSLDDYSAVEDLIRDTAPDEIYHLAAISAPGDANSRRLDAYRINTQVGLFLLEAVARVRPEARMLCVSSSEVYGKVEPGENPVTENKPAKPKGAYAVSKLMLETVCAQYAASPGIHVVVARPFNHTGPGQGEKFVAPSFAMQMARVEAGLMEPVIKTGDLSPHRDFADVRDVVRAYPAMLRQGAPGEVYNVSSGRPVSINGIYETLLGFCGSKNIRRETDTERMRPAENALVFGSSEKLCAITGWKPSIPLAKTLEDLMDDCRRRVAAEKRG